MLLTMVIFHHTGSSSIQWTHPRYPALSATILLKSKFVTLMDSTLKQNLIRHGMMKQRILFLRLRPKVRLKKHLYYLSTPNA